MTGGDHTADGDVDDAHRPAAIETAIRAGAAVFNAGHYHPAHDAWEDYWLDLESGSDDEEFLHGLIQFTAAAHHAANDRRDGAVGLAESALAYLDGLGATYRGVDLEPVRAYLDELLEASTVGAVTVPPLQVDDEVLDLDEIDGEAAVIAESLIEDSYH
jgi:predicted metal-dependent hydrolase